MTEVFQTSSFLNLNGLYNLKFWIQILFGILELGLNQNQN